MGNFILAALLLAAAATEEQNPYAFTFEKLDDGVWAGVREDGPRFPVMGSTLFVIGDTGVVVFDGGGATAMADQIIDKIRSLTDKPVTHVAISHWHGDHSFGAYRFAEEFPDVQYIAHSFTLKMMNSERLNYIDRGRSFVERNLESTTLAVETGKDQDGNDVSDIDRDENRRMLRWLDDIDAQFQLARLTPPDIVFDDSYTIDDGRKIELRFLGHGNTEGDIVMWLPEEKIVATGDIVVLPSPYAFNVPPVAWRNTLAAINALDYDILVPGHGDIQRNTDYVDLLIETADAIIAQRAELLDADTPMDEIADQLDLSEFENRFTGGDAYTNYYYHAYFDAPFRAAAVKALQEDPILVPPPPKSVPFDAERWKVTAMQHAFEEHDGVQTLMLQGGSAVIPDVEVKNALVEFDMLATGERTFAGLMFRVRDAGNYEHFYIRPHQSGNPDASQYTPVINGSSGWQLYHGEGFSAPVELPAREWIPIKVLFAGDQADIYVGGDTPLFRATDLRREDGIGTLGVNAAALSPMRFANFRYTPLADAYQFKAAPNGEALEGRIAEWTVSATFDHSALGPELPEVPMAGTVAADVKGIANLAELSVLEEGGDTVIASFELDARKRGNATMTFGYSDRAAVYVNGRRVYQGDNTYMTRDYRYLGTIGLFDEVDLPLQRGKNTISIAVTEAFGGWGVVATVEGVD